MVAFEILVPGPTAGFLASAPETRIKADFIFSLHASPIVCRKLQIIRSYLVQLHKAPDTWMP
ncbi:MAG TPA: hypothetical protein DIC22_03780 [Chitinophagaceae bacterium]|nr:hypothetical protein [Chitinophagaceae bacterium]